MIVANAPAWPAWQYVTPVHVAHAGRRGGLVRVRVPPLGIAPDATGAYPDLRVIDDAGDEIPYALDPANAPASEAREVPVIDTGFVTGSGSRAVIDLGRGAALVDTVSLAIDTDRDPTYFERVAIDASDDRAVWRNVRSDAIVYRVAQDDGRGNAAIGFPATRSRWLRIRVLDAHATLPMVGATAFRGSGTHEQPLDALALTGSLASGGTARDQTWTFAGARPFRATAVVFHGANGSFSRSARVETSDDGMSWTDAGDATISRFADGTGRSSFAFDERTARIVRVTIANGDDAPLAGVRPVLLARPHAIVFAVEPGRGYGLLSGNLAAAGATYDLGDRLAHGPWFARPAYASATVTNGGYRDPRPIGERAPWLLTAAWIAAATALGATAIVTVRRADAPGT